MRSRILENEVRSRAASADPVSIEHDDRSSEQMKAMETAAGQSNLHDEWINRGLDDTRNACCFHHDVKTID